MFVYLLLVTRAFIICLKSLFSALSNLLMFVNEAARMLYVHAGLFIALYGRSFVFDGKSSSSSEATSTFAYFSD